MKKARYWEVEDEKIRCELCPRRCLIKEGDFGFCGVRKNIKNELFSIVYGRPTSIGIDPIEKKPFYHFMPGSKTLSFSTVGCNFRCKFCCNWEISQSKIREMSPDEISPEEIIKIAEREKADGIAYTYIEPTIFFEYAFDTAKLARKKELFNVFVTNGYSMEKPLNDIKDLLDAVVINFKGNNKEFYREFAMAELEKVKRGAINYKKTGCHIEITNLVVPGMNDNLEELKELARWIRVNFGENTPYHILRFFPTMKMPSPGPTELNTLKKTWDVSRKEGLNHVYIGNVNCPEYNNTRCPKCDKVLISRGGFGIKNLMKGKKCFSCGKEINVVI